MNTKQRDCGIDCVKAIAIILVIAHHVIDFGCTISTPASTPLRFTWCLLREISCTCVNLFALATGYLCIQSANPGKHIASLWWQVFVTGILITMFFSFSGASVTWRDWTGALFPITTGEYWYFTAYFMLALFMPIINPGIRSMTKPQLVRILFVLFFILSISSLFVTTDPFVLKNGYSFAWLLVMYLFGAFWRLHATQPPQKTLLAALLIACSLSFLIPSTGKRVIPGEIGIWFGQINCVRYTSPFNIGISLAIFGLCRHIVLRDNRAVKILATISSSSLGMYLWLVHPVFWESFWRRKLGSVIITGLNQFLLHLTVIVITAFITAFSLEFVRKKMFSFISHIFDRRLEF